MRRRDGHRSLTSAWFLAWLAVTRRRVIRGLAAFRLPPGDVPVRRLAARAHAGLLALFSGHPDVLAAFAAEPGQLNLRHTAEGYTLNGYTSRGTPEGIDTHALVYYY
jgi:hypothetical protein